MKELSIEEKAKAYDEVVARIRHAFNSNRCTLGFMNEVLRYPRESEDEKIRKFLIKWIQDNYYYGITDTDIPTKTLIAWLEKQCKGDSSIQQAYEQGYTEGKRIERKHWVEKQNFSEDYNSIDPQFGKPINNVEPKFKVGDWVTNGLCAWKIDSIDEDMYYTNHCGIDCGGDIKSIDEEYHIWTIQDAKDGDVLAEDTCTFIIKKLNHDLTAEIYCCLYDDGDFEFNSNLGFDDTCTYPATKEQRDLLFQKMKEAGYEWDAEKKELRKIEQKSAKWNEEDETNSYHLKTLLENLAKDNKHEFRVISENDRDKYTAWLKSLKDRCTWKPSDEQMEALGVATNISNVPEKEYTELEKLYHDLKKLKGE